MSLYDDVLKYLNIDLTLKIYRFVIKSGVCPETTPAEWLHIICYMHERGWIKIERKDGKIESVVGRYKVKEFKEEDLDKMPEKEEGTILVVPFACSVSEDKTILKKIFNQYRKSNEISEIVFYERNSNTKFKRFKIKGDNNGKEQSTITT